MSDPKVDSFGMSFPRVLLAIFGLAIFNGSLVPDSQVSWVLIFEDHTFTGSMLKACQKASLALSQENSPS